MKILNVGQNYRVTGGADRYLLQFEDLLLSEGHQVAPFAAAHPDNRPSAWSHTFPKGVDTERPGPGDIARFLFSRSARRSMASVLEEFNPDIVHLHVTYGQLSSSILAPIRQRSVPMVQTLHDFKLGCPVRVFASHGEICEACEGRHFWRALPKRCAAGSLTRTAVYVAEAYLARWLGEVDHVDHFISPSLFVRDRLVEHEVVPSEKVTVIPNFVDPGHFAPSEVAGEYFLYFGRLHRDKGVATLIEAMSPFKDVELLIVGSGPDEVRLKNIVRRKGLEQVRFLGFKTGEELHDLIRGSIAVIVPSESYEVCPMAILEAMALARPVIGTDTGGIPELIVDQHDGYVVPTGTPKVLRQRLVQLNGDRDRAIRMGQAARRKVVRDFGPKTHYEAVSRVYERILR